eukprot:gene14964-15103_t
MVIFLAAQSFVPKEASLPQFEGLLSNKTSLNGTATPLKTSITLTSIDEAALIIALQNYGAIEHLPASYTIDSMVIAGGFNPATESSDRGTATALQYAAAIGSFNLPYFKNSATLLAASSEVPDGAVVLNLQISPIAPTGDGSKGKRDNLPTLRVDLRDVEGLRLLTYTALAFFCVIFTFSLAQSRAHAASDVIDLKFITVGPNETVSLPIGVASNNPAYTGVSIIWGDGNTTTVTSNTDSTDMTHLYAAAGTYNVKVGAPTTGSINHFGNGNVSWSAGGAAYLNSVSAWSGLTNLSGAFYGAAYLLSVPNTLPAGVTNLSYAFDGATSFNDSNISTWNTTSVTDMSYMFYGATAFNQNVDYNSGAGTWNTVAVTNMTYMFFGAVAFNNGAHTLTDWNTAAVTNMSAMFAGAILFNADIHSWSTSNVTDMSYMFFGGVPGAPPTFGTATIFNDNGVALTSWGVSKVTNYNYMFANDSGINGALSGTIWASSASATTMQGMFELAVNFDANISSWTTSHVTDMSYMFFGGTQSASAPVAVFTSTTKFNDGSTAMSWNVSAATNLNYMFANDTGINSALNTSAWAPAAAGSTMIGMFELATNFNADIHSWTTTNVTNMSFMFFGGTQTATANAPTFTTATKFNNGNTNNLSSWNVGKVTNFNFMFGNDTSVNSALASTAWAPTVATSMIGLFDGATSFNQNIAAWTTTNVNNMQYIFLNSSMDQNLSAWNVTGITASSQGLNNWENTFTVANYSATIYAWSLEAVKTGINDQVPTTYINQAGVVAHTNLAAKTWVQSVDPNYSISATVGSDSVATLGSTVTFTATVTGQSAAPNVVSDKSLWTISGTAGLTNTACVLGVTYGSPASNQATYTCKIVEVNAGTYIAAFNTGNFPTLATDTNYIQVAATQLGSSTVTVAKPTPTNTVVNTTGTTTTLGTTIVFTATVSGPTNGAAPSGNAGAWTVTGPLTTCVKAGPFASASPNVVTYTCTIANTAAGSYNAKYAYAGDTNYLAITSAVSPSTTVTQYQPTISVVGAPSSVLPYMTTPATNSITYTATVTVPAAAPAPTGTPTWVISSTPAGGPTVCSSTTGFAGSGATYTATCTLNTTILRSNYVASFTYNGDGNYLPPAVNPNASNAVAVAQASTSVAFTTATGSSNIGSNITFTAVVTGNAPQSPFPTPTGLGTFTLTIGGVVTPGVCISSGNPSGTSSLVSNAAAAATYTCTVTGASVSGQYRISSFTYAGDVNYTSSVSASPSNIITVSQATPTITLAASANPTLGSTITITATVTGPTGGAAPTGNGSWAITGVSGLTCPTTAPATSVGNVSTYTCTATTKTTGTYTFTFQYAGDTNYFGYPTTPSQALAKTVVAVTPAVAVSANAPTASVGATITFTATVTGPVNAATPAENPTWAITGVSGVTSCLSTTGPTGSSNVATFTCSVVAKYVGNYGATFTLPSDSNYLAVGATASSSNTSVSQGAPIITVTPNVSSTGLGTSFTFTAQVAPVNGGAMPSTSGTGTWQITLGGFSFANNCTPGIPTTGSSYISYTCTVVATQAGTYGASFTYGGDSNYNPATVSQSQNTSVAKVTPTVAVSTTQTTALLGDLVTYTAVVTGVANAQTPNSSSGAANWTITPGGSGLTCSSTTGPTAGVNSATYSCSFIASKAGTFGVTYNFGADTNYNAVSGTVSSNTTLVNLYPPAVSVSSSKTTANLGDTFTFTATIQGPTNGSPITGTGTWQITGVNGINCTTDTGLVGSSSTVTDTCTVTATVAGIYVPLFKYNGDSNYAATSLTSGSTTSVAKADPAVSVSANAVSAALGTTITFTATVTGPTGAVAPTASGVWAIVGVTGVTTCTTTSGPVPLLNVSTYTCNVLTSYAGNYKASFTFPGDAAYNPVSAVTSSNSTLVNVATPTINLGVTGSTTLGGSLLFTATVTGSSNASAPVGTVSWVITDNSGVSACTPSTGPNVLGIAAIYTCTVQTPYADSYSVQADFIGNGTYSSINSSVYPFTIAKQVPTITLTASGNPTVNGTTTLTTTVSGVPNAVLPSGAVSWHVTYSNGSTIPCTNPTQSAPQNGVTTYTCQFVTAVSGVYQATSTIATDGNYTAATSSIVSINLAVATPSIFVSSSPTNPTVGQTLTVTALITGQGTTQPSGTLSWTVSGAANACTTNPATVLGVNTALFTCTIAAPTAGTYDVKATYNGDSTYASLPATEVNNGPITVAPATPTIGLSSAPSNPVLGGSITFTATITGITGAATPYGSVIWTVSGPVNSCTSTTGATSGAIASQTLFTCTVNATSAGTYNVSARYVGDSNYTALANTAAAPVTIVPASLKTFVLTGSGTGALNSTLIFTAVLTGATGSVAPTGTMGFTVSATGNASSVNSCTSTPAPTTVGVVTTYICNITAIATGTYTVTANYPGDSNYISSSSNSVTLGVSANVPTVTIVASSNPTLGQTTTLTATVTGVPGFAPAGSMNWTITDGSNNPVTCGSPTGPTTVSSTVSSYTCTFSNTTAGTYSAQANFPGDLNYRLANSSTIQITIPKFTPSVTVVGVQSSGTNGQVITYTGTVVGTPGSYPPSGSPTWTFTGAANSCSATTGPVTSVVTTIYTCTVPANSAGSYSASMAYPGDNNYAAVGPTSSGILSVSKFSPIITVTTSAATTSLSSSFTFTATVTGPTAGITPTGTVSWSIAGVTGITCSNNSGPTGNSNFATYTCAVTASKAGTYIPLFTFNGDSNYLAAGPISGYTTTVNNTLPTVSVVANAATSGLGTTLSFTATVSGPNGASAPLGTGVWNVTGVTGVTACSTTSGPSVASNVSTYTCSVVAGVTGTYGAVFNYPGDVNYSPVPYTASSSSTVVSPYIPNVAVVQSGTLALGGTITFNATVTGATNATAPSGAVNWAISGTGGVTGCSSTTGPSSVGSNSTYTCQISTPNVGTYIAVATYVADSNYTTAVSSPLTLTINKQNPTITISASSNPTVGGTTTLTATITGVVNAALPTGTVSWTITDPNGATVYCTNPQSSINGTIRTDTCGLLTSIPGIYHASATIGTDSNYLSATSSTIPINLTTASPTPRLSATPTNPTVGQAITFEADLTGVNGQPTPTGTLTWSISGVTSVCTSQTGPVSSSGTAIYTCVVSTPSAGNYIASFTYNGDSIYSALPSYGPLVVSVGQSTATIGVTAAPTSPKLGDTIVFTAVVAGSTGATAPTGTVNWGISGQATTCTSRTGPLGGVGSNQSIYTCSITATSAGDYSATATFMGDTNYAALATTAPVTVTVGKASPTGNIVLVGSGGTGGVGATLTYTATVTGAGGVAPTGTMSWIVSQPNASPSCTTQPAPTISGSTTTYICTLTVTTYGNYSVTASYPGDSNYTAGVSNTVTLGIHNLTPTVSLSESGTPTLGGTMTLIALVSAPSSPNAQPATAGTYSVQANFPGDSNYQLANSLVDSVIVPKATPALSIVASQSITLAGQSITFTATIAGVAGSVPPTGAPTWSLSGGPASSHFTFTATVSGPTGGAAPTGTATWSITGVSGINCDSYTGPVAGTNSATYTCSVTATSAGVYVPLFTFNGDTNYFASALTSGGTTTVGKSTPTVAVNANAPTAALGSTVTFTATVTGPAGANAPTAVGTWVITGVTGVTSCATTIGPIPSSNVSTYTCSFIATLAGTYGASFTFPGDVAYYALSASPSMTTTLVAPATPTISVVTTGTPTLGGTLAFTATVTGSANAVAPSGTVTWQIAGSGGTTSCATTTGPVPSGVTATYVCTIQTINAGTYTAVATFANDPNYVSVTSAIDTATLARQTPIISVVASSNPTLGGTTTLTTTVAGVPSALIPTGTVTWTITDPSSHAVSCTPTGTPTTISNVTTYTCTFSTSSVGVYTVTSTIAADTNYVSATSSSINVTLGQTTPTGFITSGPSNPTVGQSITFVDTITGSASYAAPTGTVTWVVSGAASACTSFTNPASPPHTSAYGCVILAPVAGTYTVIATYNGDANYSSLPASAPSSLTVTAATPTIAVTSSPVSPIFGGTITYTATVSGLAGANAPGGTVTWAITGAGNTCASKTGPVAGLSSTQTIFTCVVNASPAGTYHASVTYNGDSNYLALGAQAAADVVVPKATPTIVTTGVVTGGGGLGSSLDFTATVTGTSGATGPTGVLTWTVSGPSGISSCTSNPTTTFVGSVTTYHCSITATAYGAYTVTAHYPGDINYIAVVDTPFTLGISQVTPTVTLVYSGTPSLGGTTTLTATVTGPSGGQLPGGVMAWTVTDPSNATVTCTNSGSNPTTVASNSSSYSCTFPTATAGSYSATANFPGDTNYQIATSNTISISVPKATPTLSVAGVQSTGSNGQIITYAATITGATGSLAPTGAPTWTLGGPTGTCSTTSGPVTNGLSSIYNCVIPAIYAGTYTASITYAGDSNYTGVGPSTAFSIVVTKSTPTVIVTTSASTATLGSSFTFTATVTGPTGGASATGTGTWSIAGVTGVSCNNQTGPTGNTNSVTYTCSVTATSSGVYIPVFTFNGDSNYFATAPTSGATTTVGKSTPTVSVVAGSTSAQLGSTITFTATVTGPTGATAPSGIGTWAISGVTGVTTCTSTTGPSAALNVSTYVCSVVASRAGSYTGSFTFPGDTAYNSVSSASSTTSTTVSSATPTIALSASASTLTLGGTVTYTATVTGSANAVAPAGAVTFVISGSAGASTCASQTGPTSAGIVSTYTCTVQTPSAGTYIAQANFAADSNYTAVSSTGLTSTLVLQTPAITVTASSNPTLGGTSTLTTTVTGVNNAVQPTGAVTWLVKDPTNQTVTCTNSGTPATVSNVTTYTCTFVTSLPGTYSITSTIAADSNYASATSSILTMNLGQSIATIFVSNTPSNPTVGQPLTFTALVSGSASLAAPAGALTWNVSGAATTCTATSGPVTGAHSSLYTCQISTPIAGTYTVSATYLGDGNFAALATTTPIPVVVSPATPTIAVTTTPATPVFGDAITFTATVSGIVGATAPAGTLTWNVTGAATTCTKVGPTAGSSSNQTLYTCSLTAIPAGSYNVTATYNGDSNYTALAATPTTTVVIPKVAPTVVLTSSGGGSLGSTITFTATVTGTAGTVAPTNSNGGVVWSISGTGAPLSCSSSTAGTSAGVITTYTCSIVTTSYGSFIVTANYQGDINYSATASNQVTTGIATLTPTIGSITNTTTALGGSTTLSVVLTGSSGFTPGGSMTWNVKNPSLATVNCTTQNVLPNTPASLQTTYTCVIPTATAGTYTAVAFFPGDANYNPVTSSSANIVVSKNTPTIAVTGVQSSTAGGQIITYTATITGTTGSLAPTGAPTWTVTGPNVAADSCSSNSGPATTGVASTYTCVVPATAAGTYTAAVSVAADSNYFAANDLSNPFSLVIAQSAPIVTVATSSASATLGSTFTFTATVTGPVGGVTPTGTGSWSIIGVSGITCSTNSGPTLGASQNIVTYSCAVVASSAGIYAPLFTFNGDANYSATAPTSGYTTTVAKATPTVVVTDDTATASLGDTLTFTATVTGPTNAIAPTASGIWAITGVSGVTSCTTTTGPSASLSVATYHCTVVATRAGSYSATFTFPGDSAYNAVAAVTSSTSTTVAP